MKLATRILLLIVAIVSLSALAHVGLTRYQQVALNRESEAILAQTIVNSVRDAVVRDVIDGNALRVASLLQSIQRDNDPIEYLFVTGLDGGVFAHSFEVGFPRYLARQDFQMVEREDLYVSRRFRTGEQLIYEYHAPLIEGLEPTVYIGINQSNITARLSRSSGLTLLTSFVIALLAIGLGLASSRRITAPLTRFTDFLRRYGISEKARFKAVGSSTREIDELAGAFAVAAKSRDNAVDALRAQQRDLAITLDSIGDAIVVFDDTGSILSFNKSAERVFEYAAQEIVGRKINSLFVNDVETRELPTAGSSRETEALHKNGEQFPVRLNLTSMPRTSDAEQRFIASCQDLTVAREQEEQIRRTQKMDALGKLTGGMAHDFNNLLGIILGYANLLEVELEKNATLAGYVDEITRATERGARLSQRLLAFSRRSGGRSESVDINSLLERERDLLKKSLTPRIDLEYELESDLWPVLLDEGDLADAIINMAINAAHAINDTGKLLFRTRNKSLDEINAETLGLEPGDYVEMSVVDSGCGMSDETRSRMFEPFFTTKEGQGTGLGLSQVYGMVERSHGAVNVHSQLGQGTRVDLYFPRQRESAQVLEGEDRAPVVAALGTETILVVDDEPALLKLNTSIISSYGYRVITAGSGAEALEILEREKVDLVFSDVLMPGMDGFRLAAIVAKQYPDTKIQLASGFTDGPGPVSTDGYLRETMLRKPYSSHDLLDAIRATLDR